MDTTKISASQPKSLTLNDFLHGRPDKLIQAHKSPKILILSVHGNEELAPRLAYHLQINRPDLLKHVDYLCGNPEAAAQVPAAGYLESDLNRCFGLSRAPKTHEEHRAADILAHLRQGSYDYTLTLHTSVTDIGKFIIVGSISPTVSKIIAASDFDRIVIMPPPIVGASISGQSPRIVEFEVNEKVAELPETIAEFTRLIENLITPAPKPKPREIFYVDRTIPKTEDPGINVPNFTWCEAGYYPVLMGTGKHSYRENPTKSYVGFAATRREIITI